MPLGAVFDEGVVTKGVAMKGIVKRGVAMSGVATVRRTIEEDGKLGGGRPGTG